MTHPAIIGHAQALKEVQEAFTSGRMPHAWLIAGIEGIGKAALAKHIAQYVLSNGTTTLGAWNSEDRAAKLVEAETHPDLLIIRRPTDEKTGTRKSIIPVEEMQKIGGFFHKTATHGGWRIVILDEVHALNRHGQNAILKIVEEPPPRALILLTVTTPGVLLPTIRSRTRLLELSPLGPEEMRTIVKSAAQQTSPEDIETVINLSQGSVGFALKILRTQTLPLYREMIGILDLMPILDVARLHKLADQIARKADAESFEALSALLIERLRQTILDEAQKHPEGRVDVALDIWDKTKATFITTEFSNLDRKLAFITAVNDIRAALST